MSEYGRIEFEKEVNKVYDILWKMFQSGNWDMEKVQKLMNILNCIDKELDR